MQFGDILALAGLRADGRQYEEVRRLSYKLGGYLNADGSAYVEQGLNKVLVSVFGPSESAKRAADGSEDKATIVCQLLNAPFSGPDWRKRRTADRKTQELEAIIKNTFEAVVLLESYPKSQIDISIDILESDGSLLCTIINGVTLALMDAGVAMADMVCACSCGMRIIYVDGFSMSFSWVEILSGFIKQQLCLDLNQTEQNTATFYLPVAIKARTKEIVFMQMDSRLSVANLELALETGLRGCGDICTTMEKATRDAMDPASVIS